MRKPDSAQIADRLVPGVQINIRSAFLKPQGLYEITWRGPYRHCKDAVTLARVGKRGRVLKGKRHRRFMYPVSTIVNGVICGLRRDNQRIDIVRKRK